MTDSKPAATKGKGGRPKKDAAPPIDFTALEFKEAELPKPDNPFRKPLGESYEYDSARAVVIPAAGEARAARLLRSAAEELKIGVSIVTRALENEDGSPTGTVELIFKGKERRKRKSQGEDAPDTGPAPVSEDAGNAPASEPAAV